jgi:acetyl-CoA synthetase
MNAIVWEPSPDRIERANVTRLMRRYGIASLAELRRRSMEDVSWFWDAVVRDLELPLGPYGAVFEAGDGIEWARWFSGARVNLAAACVTAPAAADPDRPAVVGESEDGRMRTLTRAELEGAVAGLVGCLDELGVGPGEAVGVFMPMIPEAVVAAYAVAALGAIYVPIFSGFGAPAVAERLREVDARVVLTADGTVRRGRRHEMKPVLDEALGACPAVEAMVVAPNLGGPTEPGPVREIPWPRPAGGGLRTAATTAEDPFMVIFTSGTSGRPKGVIHVHGGFLVKVAAEAAYQADLRPGDVALWPTDMGWIMGPWMVIGAHALGATVVLWEGAPDHPAPDRLWRSAERHGVTVLGVSPSLVRGLMRQGADGADADLSSLLTVLSGGEPWTPEAYEWLRNVTGGSRPIVNLSGGTEVGACFLSCHPVEPIKAGSLGGPALGMDVDVVDAAGESIRGCVGELVCRQPWPGMTRGLWRDPERYLRAYWSTYPGLWRHGDRALVDSDGHWFLLGRSDDVLNVGGKRLGPAEVEAVLLSHPGVSEAAAVGVPDAERGEAIWCFCVPSAAGGAHPGLAEELLGLAAAELGAPFRPTGVVFVEALPKTRSAKIVRRVVRAVAAGETPGDLSGVENPEALEALGDAVRRAPMLRR